jgi:hypothetical protein
MVRGIIQFCVRQYADANDEEIPTPGKRMMTRSKARIILDSFAATMVVILRDGKRVPSE